MARVAGRHGGAHALPTWVDLGYEDEPGWGWSIYCEPPPAPLERVEGWPPPGRARS